MSIVAPPRAQSSTSTPETPQNTATHTTNQRWCTRPRDGRVAAILAHTAQGHRPFTKAQTPEGFTAKGKRQFNAAKESLATKHAYTPAPLHIKRVSRAQETSPRAIAWAIPQGSRKVDHTAQAWRAARSLDELLCRRKDCQRNIMAVLWVLLRYTDHTTMTVRITWDTLASKARVSRATVGNALKFLRTHGLLGIVASGRSATYAAKAGQPATNEAPVYVITRPVGLGLRPQDAPDTTPKPATHAKGATGTCGNNLEPLPVGGLTTYEVSSYTRTREKNTQIEPLRGTENHGHGYAVRTHHRDERQVTLWPANRRISSRSQGLSAAAEILRLMPDLARFSKKNVLNMVKPFFDAGWTISDVHHALDWRTSPGLHGKEVWGALPQHDRDTQSYIDYCRILRAAILYRLRQWMTPTGEVMTSRSQRATAQSTQARAAARAAADRRAKYQAQRPAHQSAAATGAARARAALSAARALST
ncbi:hypothetical protein AA310_00920 [Arthrobacter sp. YC-RL1]|uniref:hypothetical protein n=1 Tax=Arthrobacter sp. YC-RL1 TaxID=1652545 RepID=UPI00063D936A|nr:hypothetical protein [Arthrobacter sp. YC-RL1]ALQ32520.1 hypothetical protein ATC04_17815 [Arthrobacter sp. YC-RL1]ALQ32595.1 hypothetical protein ATC04_18250 [Arthrobacter sp. YC-RL1]KLI90527.1 hypothetical protein AA310_00920 [Arthrobacter sp. YC-RL1]